MCAFSKRFYHPALNLTKNQFCGLPKFNDKNCHTLNIFSALCSPDYVCRNGQFATSKFGTNKDLESPK